MSITFPVQFPTYNIRSVNIRARSIVGMSVSPFTGQQQVYQHSGQWWEMEITLPPMKAEDAEAVAAFLLKMNGSYGTFLLGDPANRAPRGVGTGTPLVNGSGQSGNSLVTDGWTASQTGILKAGDWIQLGTGTATRLHRVLSDANSDASGNATFDIWPNLRSSPSDNAAIIVNSTQGQWRLASNEMQYSIGGAKVYSFTIACMEAI